MSNAITKLPLTQFSGIDFANILADITTLVTENPDYNSNWDDFLSSNAGRMMIELFAYIADQLATRIDWAANENFISIATQDSSILDLLKLVYYKLSLSSSSSVNVNLTLQVPVKGQLILTPAYTELSGVRNNIFSLTALDKNGNSKNFEFIDYNPTTNKFDYKAQIAITGSITNPITNTYFNIYEGTTKITTFTSSSSENPHFQISDNNIIANSIRVYLITTVDGITAEQELLQVENFLDKDAYDVTLPIPYVVNVTNVGKAEIEFAPSAILSDPSRQYPAGQTIQVFYRVGNGALGNIAAKSINTNHTLVDSNGISFPILFVNLAEGSGGVDAETIAHAQLNGPMVATTSKKTVTVNDYAIILNKFTNTLTSKTYGSINAPTDFYAKYGRNLSPIDVWNFILLNKNYGNVPPSQYNNYKWVNTRKENRFNELYSFNTGRFNIIDSLPQTIVSSIPGIISAFGGPVQNFNNALPFYMDDDYKQQITTSSTDFNINQNLKVKFSSTPVTTTFFNLINLIENYSVQWLNVGTVLGVTLNSGSTTSYFGTTPTTYDIRIDGINYSVPYYTTGRTSNTYSNIAKFINTSLNSTFSGTTTNLNDFVIIGEINNDVPYTIQISATGTPDSFVWQKNGVFSSPILITTNPVIIDSGAFTIQFLNTTGHTLGNTWVISNDNKYFCSYELNLQNSLWDVKIYNSTGSTNTISIMGGLSNDILAKFYNTTSYVPLVSTPPQSSSINGIGFINGDKTQTGLGYIGGTTVSVDTQNCNAEWVASYSVTDGTSTALYGYDVSLKNSIGINIDGRGMITVPLTPSSDYGAGDKKLILLSNPTPLTVGYISGSINVASYKIGIVERINRILSLNSGSYGSSAPSVQWLNIGSGLTNNSSSSTMSATAITYHVNINSIDKVVPYAGTTGAVGTRKSSQYSDLANYINTSLNAIHTLGSLDDMLFIGQISQGITYTVKISATGTPDSFQWKLDSGSWSSSIPITGSAQTITSGADTFSVLFLKTTGHTTSDTWTITAGSAFCTWAMNQGSTNWDVKFFSTNGVTVSVSQGAPNDLLTALYGGSSYVVPTAIPAGDYSQVASVVTDTLGKKYLKLTSPSTGVSSTIQFIVSDYSTTLSTSIEFMDVLGVIYELTGNTSNLCIGQKKLSIITNPNSQYFGYGIYEHNSITYASFYPKTIYAHFVASQKNNIELGSVYNNFYVTGDETLDITYKNAINKVYNTNVYTNGIPNVEASSLELKFTNEPVLSNSIDAIETADNRIDIYSMDYVKIPTKDLRAMTAGYFTATDYFIFKIDSMTKMEVALNNASTITDVYNYLSNALHNINGVALSDMTNYLEYDKVNPYILWIKSYAKNPTGNITLYRTPASSNYGDNYGLSKIIGNPNVNSSIDPVALMQFSKLYFSDGALVDFHLVNGTINEGGATIYHDALPFVYRFIDPITKLPRDPDYYLSYENNKIDFTGIGLNDLSFTSGSISNSYTVKISATNSPDSFQWKPSSGSYSVSIPIISGDYAISNGKDSFTIKFNATTGHTLGNYWTISPMNKFLMNKTAVNKIPDNEFYISFINDRDGELDSLGNPIVIDEDIIQSYLDEYRLTSVTNIISQPLFETFDLAITVTYNPNIPLSGIQPTVKSLLTSKYNVANAVIGSDIIKSKIIADIHSIQGVLYLNVDYLGKDYTDHSTNVLDAIPARFDEALVLSEDRYDINLTQSHGIIANYIALIK